MAHVVPTRLGCYAPRPHSSPRQWSWRRLAGVDAASGIGMLLIGIAASGPAGIIALALGCLVLVESGYLIVGLRRRPQRLDYRPRQ